MTKEIFNIKDLAKHSFENMMLVALSKKKGWDFISEHRKLNEDFIREYNDKLDWNLLCEYQKLSEDFMREFYYKLHWSKVWNYQRSNFSTSFIREFVHTMTVQQRAYFGYCLY